MRTVPPSFGCLLALVAAAGVLPACASNTDQAELAAGPATGGGAGSDELASSTEGGARSAGMAGASDGGTDAGSDGGNAGTAQAGTAGQGGDGPGGTAGGQLSGAAGQAGATSADCPEDVVSMEGKPCENEDQECAAPGSEPAYPLVFIRCTNGEWELYRGIADPDACPSDLVAADGTTCWSEGKVCTESSGTGDCAYLTILTCMDSFWVRQESAPNPNCGAGGAAPQAGAGGAAGPAGAGGAAGQAGAAGAGGSAE